MFFVEGDKETADKEAHNKKENPILYITAANHTKHSQETKSLTQ